MNLEELKKYCAEIPLIISALHHYIISNTRKDVKNMDTMEKALSLKKKIR